MKKGLKQKISLILVMAMILGLSLPVSAKENRSVFDETIITEETFDQTVIEEESSMDNAGTGYSLFGDMSASGDSVAGDTNRSGYRMLSLWNQYLYSKMRGDAADAAEADGSEEIIENLGEVSTTPFMTIYNLNNNSVIGPGTDYSYDNNTITINSVSANEANGLEIKLTSTENVELNLEWQDSANNNVPVTLTADSSFTSIGTINIVEGDTDKKIKAGTDTLVVKKPDNTEPSTAYTHICSTGNENISESYSVYVARETDDTALVGDQVTIVNDTSGYPTLNFRNPVLGAATISSSDVGDVNYEADAWYASGSGKSIIVFGSGSDVTSMKTLEFKSLGPIGSELVFVDSADSSSVFGRLQNADNLCCYEGAAFYEQGSEPADIVPNSISSIPISSSSVSTGDAFTIMGLASSTSYFAGARIVKNNSSTRYQIQDDKILYIPSGWRWSETPKTTSAASTSNTYVIKAKNGEETSGTAPTSLKRVVFGGEVKTSETAQLVLTKNNIVQDQNVTWSSSNPEAITVNPDTGVIAIATGATAGAKATISALYNQNTVAMCDITVSEEGGDVTICDSAGKNISRIEAVTNTENTKFYINYPASMGSGLTLSTPQIDKSIIKVEAGQKTETGALVSVPYTIKSSTSTENAIVKIQASYTPAAGTTYTKDLVLEVSVIGQLLEFENVNISNNGYRYIKINSISANEPPKVLAPVEWNKKEYSFASNNTSIADVHPTSGIITSKSVGVAKFTGTLEGTTMESRDLYVVDPTPTVIAPTTIHWDKPFTVTATFPGDYYTASGIQVSATISGGNAKPGITTSELDNGKLTVTLSKGTLSEEALKAKTMNLTFTVTAKSDITGESGINCQQITKTVNIWNASQGQSISEPDEQASGGAAQNLWYTDVELKIPGFVESGASTTGTGKWTQFYEVGEDGTVTVKPQDAKNRKKAVTPSYSLIVLPVMDGGTKVGELHYALPVYFKKPLLKLTSTSGTVKTPCPEAGQVLKTTVMEKKSNGAFENLDLSDQREDVTLYAPKDSSKIKDIESDGATVLITAKGKTAGKIQVQLDNWCDSVNISYAVKESRKTVLTVDKKTICMNKNAYKSGEPQTVKLFVNGSEWTSDTPVSVTLPKDWDQKNIELTGIEEGKVTASEIEIAYKKDEEPKAGNYSIKLKTDDNVSITFKISVSKAALDGKAVTLKKQTDMDLTKKQKLVLIPQLKGIGGEIQDVAFKSGSSGANLYDVEYEPELNQIYVTPKDWADTSVNAKNQKYTLEVKVGGVTCEAEFKFTPKATKPAVKIDKVTLDKTKVMTSDGNGIYAVANVLCTYKTGGKTFTIDPIDPEKGGVEFYEGNTKLTADTVTGLYKLKNGATFHLEYDITQGVLKLTDYYQEKGKGGTVKVRLLFPGQTKQIIKNLSIKTK